MLYYIYDFQMNPWIQVVLWSASGIYFFAFFSLYHQLPGLYSDNGILPVHSALQISSKTSPLSQFKEQKNLLIFTKYLKITIYDGMELLCFFGTVLSTLMMITKKLRNPVSFILLYICYLSCYKENFQSNPSFDNNEFQFQSLKMFEIY